MFFNGFLCNQQTCPDIYDRVYKLFMEMNTLYFTNVNFWETSIYIKMYEVFAELSKKYNCEFDDRGTIGKRYRRMDEIGTPFCITYDFDSEEDKMVTIRHRDTMEQERIAIADLDAYFADKFTF